MKDLECWVGEFGLCSLSVETLKVFKQKEMVRGVLFLFGRNL